MVDRFYLSDDGEEWILGDTKCKGELAYTEDCIPLNVKGFWCDKSTAEEVVAYLNRLAKVISALEEFEGAPWQFSPPKIGYTYLSEVYGATRALQAWRSALKEYEKWNKERTVVTK